MEKVSNNRREHTATVPGIYLRGHHNRPSSAMETTLLPATIR